MKIIELTSRWRTGSVQCRVVRVGSLTLIADFEDCFNDQHKVWVGRDSLDLLWAMQYEPPYRRHLEVGAGTGLLALASAGSDVVAIDINPRAVNFSRVNALINARPITILEQDVFTVNDKFDLVTWNLPFMFLPEQEKQFAAGYGGHLGIELLLRFLQKKLPDLLSPDGRALILAQQPIMQDGSNALMPELARVADKTGLNIQVKPIKVWWDTYNGAFHREQGVDRWILTLLRVTHGTGKVTVESMPLVRRLVGAVRRWVH